MKAALIFFLMLIIASGDIHKVAKINEAKSQAEKAYQQRNYKQALDLYSLLTDSLDVTEETVLLNKAHCYYHLKNLSKAKSAYTSLSNAKDKVVRSIANQQLGILAYQEKNQDLAKNYFKAALKALPQNNEARYNYELMAKLLANQNKNENKSKENKNPEKPFEPSAFAKKLKAQAEAMAGTYKYNEAYQLMMDGVKKDKSVLYYKDFIDRLKVIADISKL